MEKNGCLKFIALGVNMKRKMSEVFKLLYENQVKRDNYLDSVPLELREAIAFNNYGHLLQDDLDTLIESFFDKFEWDVKWFLYDWKPGFKVENQEIWNIDQYIEYLKETDGFE